MLEHIIRGEMSGGVKEQYKNKHHIQWLSVLYLFN